MKLQHPHHAVCIFQHTDRQTNRQTDRHTQPLWRSTWRIRLQAFFGSGIHTRSRTSRRRAGGTSSYLSTTSAMCCATAASAASGAVGVRRCLNEAVLRNSAGKHTLPYHTLPYLILHYSTILLTPPYLSTTQILTLTMLKQ